MPGSARAEGYWGSSPDDKVIQVHMYSNKTVLTVH